MPRVVRTRPLPGLLGTDPPGRWGALSWGPLAGLVGHQPLDEWKRGWDYGLRMVLAEDLVRAQDLDLLHPRTRVYEDEPQTCALFEAMPVFAIHESLWAPLAARGCRLLRVAYSRVPSLLQLETVGPGWPTVRMDLSLDTIYGTHGFGAHSLGTIDRLLRAATCGAVSELAVRAAERVAREVDTALVTPGGPAKLAAELREYEQCRRELDPEIFDFIDDPRPISGLWDSWSETYVRALSWGQSFEPVTQELVAALERGEGPDEVVLEEPTRVLHFRLVRCPAATLEVDGPAGPQRLHIPATIQAETPYKHTPMS